MTDRLKDLAQAGVSIWLDDLSRQRLTSGNLADLVATKSVTGVTTNPTIFAGALSDGESYQSQVKLLADRGVSVAEAIKAITTDDVRSACDVLAETNRNTGGADGRVSIEVEPGLARDTEATIEQAKELTQLVDRDNVLIKIPATVEGLPAITAVIAAGISVNVTLIFSLERYRAVIDAYLEGLEQAAGNGTDLATIHSVASFFVSRVDTEVDKRLAKIGNTELRGKAAVANARLAYGVYLKSLHDPRWEGLASRGANAQRPLWASTGVKNPDYSDTMYVTDLVAANTVNTMPEKTLAAFADHGEVTGDQISGNLDSAQQTLDALAEAGIDFDDVVAVLEDEGVDKFVDSWNELVTTVDKELNAAVG